MCGMGRQRMPAPPPPVPKQVFTPPQETDANIQSAASDARERAMRGGRRSTILSALGGSGSGSTTRTLLGG